MTETLYSIYTESSTEPTTSLYSENILSSFASEDITESINNNTLISSINSMVSFQSKLKQKNISAKELPNEILLKIFDNLDDLKDILNLRCVSRKFKSLSEVKLYDIIEEKINALEYKKKSLERRLSHMKNHLCPRLSHYKVFLNVISRSDVSELCNLPKPPREVKYIFSVLYILYTGGNNCQCVQCIENRNNLNKDEEDGLNLLSNSFGCSSNNNKKIVSRHSFSMSDLATARTNTPYESGEDESSSNSSNCSNANSRRNSFNDFSSIDISNKKNNAGSSSQLDKKNCDTTDSTTTTYTSSKSNNNSNSNSNSMNDTIEKQKEEAKEEEEEGEEEKEEVIEIPNWEEVRQVINKNDFRNWVMNLHSNLDAVPKEHILLANNLLNKPRATQNSKSSSNNDSTASEYENLRLTYDRMLIVSQIGYKILLFIEAIIQSFFLT
jgi:hypothetical protein